MAFHENLRIQRLAKGLTQPALAEAAQIEQSYLSKLENGRSSPSDEVLARLASALATSAEELMRNGADSAPAPDQRLLIGAAFGIALIAAAGGWFARDLAAPPHAPAVVPDPLHGSMAERLEGAAPPGMMIELVQLDDDGSVTVTGRIKDRSAVAEFIAAARQVGFGEATTMMLSDGDSRFHLRLAPAKPAPAVAPAPGA